MVCVIILEDLADLFDNKRSAQQTLWSHLQRSIVSNSYVSLLMTKREEDIEKCFFIHC